MAENDTQNPPASQTDPPGSAGGPGSGSEPPAGFVSLADLEREQQRSRAFQSELDRTKVRLDELEKKATEGKPTNDGGESDRGPGFDPAEFERRLLTNVYGAAEKARAAEALRQQFPHADSSLFTAGKLAEFGSVDALRIAVEDSHNRVASILTEGRAAIEEQVRKEFAEKYGIKDDPVGGSGSEGTVGDPTVDQIRAMTLQDQLELEKKNPGVIKRVLRSASQL